MAMQRVMQLEKEKKDKLTRFYTDLYANKIRLQVSAQEITEIRDAVSGMVRRIANKVEEICPRFKINDVVLVGSAREGTQIIRPEEYDFLLILEMLSRPGALEMKKMCIGNENCVHVIVKDKDVKRQFIDLIDGDELRSNQDSSPFVWKKGLRESFYHVLKEALRKLMNNIIQTPTGILEIKYSSLTMHGPALNPCFQWYRQDGTIMKISVDLCPVIRQKGDYPDVMNLETVSCETYYHYAGAVGSLMLLPCKRQICPNGHCFSVNFTETEVLLIKDLSQHHRKCYMILKYLLNAKMRPSWGGVFDWMENIVEPETAFFSYILKVLILQHHYELMCTETTCLASCIERLLHKMLSIALLAKIKIIGIPYRRNMLSSPFFKNHNIWSSHSGKFADHDLNLRLRILLIDLDIIGKTKEYTFENCRISSVRAINIRDLALPSLIALLASLISIYLDPDFGHLTEKTLRYCIWKYIELGKILWILDEPVECKNENCCVSAAERKELREKYDSGLSLANIYFMLALEVSILSIYIYPDFGHSSGAVATFLGRKLIELYQEK